MTTIYFKEYNQQRRDAASRGIDWFFDFDSWLVWWGADITLRGKGKNKLCMARKNDTGAYSPNNCYKATFADNVSDARKNIPYKPRQQTTFVNISASLSKQLKTPFGIFKSGKDAARSLGVTPAAISWRVKNKPADYYYI